MFVLQWSCFFVILRKTTGASVCCTVCTEKNICFTPPNKSMLSPFYTIRSIWAPISIFTRQHKLKKQSRQASVKKIIVHWSITNLTTCCLIGRVQNAHIYITILQTAILTLSYKKVEIMLSLYILFTYFYNIAIL